LERTIARFPGNPEAGRFRRSQRTGPDKIALISADHFDWLRAALKCSFRAEETPISF